MNEQINTLQFKNISIGHENNALIEYISLTLQAPCLVGLIGNNGSGKTTLLKTISGLQKKVAGSFFYNEKDISSLNSKDISKIISFGFAFNSNVFPIRVYELVSMGRYPYLNNMATLTEADDKIILETIDILGISLLKDKLITAISDGERQKAYIAKALAQQTPVLLLDEPTAFLDYTSKKHFFKTVKENAISKKVITLISSHDIDFLSRYADHLLMIQEDKKVVYEKTEIIIQSDYYKTNFNY